MNPVQSTAEIVQIRNKSRPSRLQLSSEMASSLAALITAAEQVMPGHPYAAEIAVRIAVSLSDAGWIISRDAFPRDGGDAA